jgi:hypothetical protein
MFAPALAMYITVEHLTPKNRGGENIERSVFNLEAVTAKKYDEEGKICGEELRFDGENVYHPNHATWCTGTETNFRVPVAARESNCKIVS